MFDMLYGSYLHVLIMIHAMFIFINNIIYVIIILLIYGIKMTWKLPNILTIIIAIRTFYKYIHDIYTHIYMYKQQAIKHKYFLELA